MELNHKQIRNGLENFIANAHTKIYYPGGDDLIGDSLYLINELLTKNADWEEEYDRCSKMLCDVKREFELYKKHHCDPEFFEVKNKIKADTAREIFEEIENALELLQRCVEEGRKNDGIKYQQLHDGRILSIEAVKYFVAELKNKYIGKDINVLAKTEGKG